MGIQCGKSSKQSICFLSINKKTIENQTQKKFKDIEQYPISKIYNILLQHHNPEIQGKAIKNTSELVVFRKENESSVELTGPIFSIEIEKFLEKVDDISKSIKTVLDFKNLVFISNKILYKLSKNDSKSIVIDSNLEKFIMAMENQNINPNKIGISVVTISNFVDTFQNLLTKSAGPLPQMLYSSMDFSSPSKASQMIKSSDQQSQNNNKPSHCDQYGSIFIQSTRELYSAIESLKIEFIDKLNICKIVIVGAKDQFIDKVKETFKSQKANKPKFEIKTCSGEKIGSCGSTLKSILGSQKENLQIIFDIIKDLDSIKSYFCNDLYGTIGVKSHYQEEYFSYVLDKEKAFAKKEAENYVKEQILNYADPRENIENQQNLPQKHKPDTPINENKPERPKTPIKRDQSQLVLSKSPQISKKVTQNGSKNNLSNSVVLIGRVHRIYELLKKSFNKKNLEKINNFVNMMSRLLENIIANYNEPKYKTIKNTNEKIKQNLFQLKDSNELLKECGFYKVNDIEYTCKADLTTLKMIKADMNLAFAEQKKLA